MSEYLLQRVGNNGRVTSEVVSDDNEAGAALIAQYRGTPQLRPLDSETRQAVAEQQQVERNIRNLEDDPLGPLASAGAGVFDELTLGAGERLFLNEAQGRRAQGARAAFEGLPYLGGRAGTQAAGAVLSGGGTALEQGIGVGTQAGLGNFVGNAVSRALMARGLQGAGGRALAYGSGALTDATISGALQTITDANIQGRPIEGEELAANIGIGVGLGLLGTGIHAAGTGLRARFSPETARILRDNGLGSEDIRMQADLADGAYRGIPERGAALPESDHLAAQVLTDPNLSRITGLSEAQQMQIRQADAFGMRRATDNNSRQAFNRQVAAQLEDGIAAGRIAAGDMANATARRTALGGDLSDITPEAVSRAQEAVLGLRRRLEGVVAARPVEGVLGPSRRLLDLLPGEEDLNPFALSTDGAAFATRLDEALQQIRSRGLDRGLEDAEMASEAVALRDGIRSALREMSPSGARLSQANELLDNLENSFRGDLGQRLGVDSRRSGDFRVNRAKLSGMLEDSSYHLRDETLPLVNQALSDMAALNRLVDEANGGTVGAEATARLNETAAALGEAQTWATHAANMRSIQADLTNNAGLMSSLPFLPTLLGGFLGGPVGGVIGAGLSTAMAAITHPISALRWLDGAGSGIKATRLRLGAGAEALGRALSGKAVTMATREAARLPSMLRNHDEREEAYRFAVDRIRALAGNPALLTAQLEDVIGPAATYLPGAVAPTVAMSMTQAVHYLAMSLPPADQPSPFPGPRPPPSSAEMRDFLRRTEALEDPTILLSLAAAQRLSTEHVEAVQAVYPALLAEIRALATEQVVSLQKRPPYAQRMQVALLLGLDTEPSLQGPMLLRLQQTYSQTPEQRRVTPEASAAREAAANTSTSQQRVDARLG